MPDIETKKQNYAQFLQSLSRDDLIVLLEYYATVEAEIFVLSRDKPIEKLSFSQLVAQRLSILGTKILNGSIDLLPTNFVEIKKILPDWKIPDSCYQSSLNRAKKRIEINP